MLAVGLPSRDVGNVNFNNGNANGANAVGKGNGSVGVASRVHHHGIIVSIGFLKFVDKTTFMVGLVVNYLML